MGIEITNWSNFSAAEILELKKSGVAVPSDVYKMAKATYEDEVTQTSEEITSYELVDTSGTTDEADDLYQKLLNDMGGEGNRMENLREIGKIFIQKSEKEQKTILKDLAAMTKLAKEIEKTQEETEKVVEEAEEDTYSWQVELEELIAKQEAGTLTEDEQERMTQLQGWITSANEKANTKVANLTLAQKKIGAKIATASIRAGNSQETGDKTSDIGKKLTGDTSTRKGHIIGGAATAAVATTSALYFSGLITKHATVMTLGLSTGPAGWIIAGAIAVTAIVVAIFGGRKDKEANEANQKVGQEAIKVGEQLSGYAEQTAEKAQEAAEANSFTIEYKDAEIPEFDDTFEEKPTEDEDEEGEEK